MRADGFCHDAGLTCAALDEPGLLKRYFPLTDRRHFTVTRREDTVSDDIREQDWLDEVLNRVVRLSGVDSRSAVRMVSLFSRRAGLDQVRP